MSSTKWGKEYQSLSITTSRIVFREIIKKLKMEPKLYRHIRKQLSAGAKILASQSNGKYTLLKENNEYFIECNRSGEKKSLGNKDQAEEIILYGIPKNYKL